MRRAASHLSIAAMACLCSAGCLSMGVMDLSTGPRYRFGRMTGITGAAIAGREVFVQVDVLRPGRIEPEPVVFRIEIDQRAWAYRHSVPRATYANGLSLAHIPAGDLVAPGAIPEDATRLPVEPIDIERFADLQTIGRRASSSVRVLAIHYRPLGDDLDVYGDRDRGVPPPGDTLLAILGEASELSPDPIFISDIQDGHSTRRGWLVLMPLAAAGDAAALPFELCAAIIAAIE